MGLGLSEAEPFDDENLLALCAECNAGQGRDTLPLRFMATAACADCPPQPECVVSEHYPLRALPCWSVRR